MKYIVCPSGEDPKFYKAIEANYAEDAAEEYAGIEYDNEVFDEIEVDVYCESDLSFCVISFRIIVEYTPRFNCYIRG